MQSQSKILVEVFAQSSKRGKEIIYSWSQKWPFLGNVEQFINLILWNLYHVYQSLCHIAKVDIPHDVTVWTLLDTINSDWLYKRIKRAESVTYNRYCLYFREYMQL